MLTRASAPTLISLPDAAERLNLHRATINAMVKDERLPAQRVGPHWYIDERDLEAFARTYVRPRNAPRRRSTTVEPSIEILGLLCDWEEATVNELMAVVDLHPGTIRKHLCIAEAQGLAVRDDLSQWSLTTDGRAYLARQK